MDKNIPSRSIYLDIYRLYLTQQCNVQQLKPILDLWAIHHRTKFHSNWFQLTKEIREQLPLLHQQFYSELKVHSFLNRLLNNKIRTFPTGPFSKSNFCARAFCDIFQLEPFLIIQKNLEYDLFWNWSFAKIVIFKLLLKPSFARSYMAICIICKEWEL